MMNTHQGYNSGHPWYYHLGGKRLTLKEIREDVKASGYQGYRADDIHAADAMPEPRRSERLRALRAEAKQSLAEDVSRYRELARKLTAYRRETSGQSIDGVSDCVHTDIGLKHNHIYNEFAHLHVIGGLLAKQRDLFDLL